MAKVVCLIAGLDRRFYLAPLLLLMSFSPQAYANDANCMRPSSSPPAEAGEPGNLAGLKSELVYYQCSGAYAQEFDRVINDAISYIIQRSRNGAMLALVLDIDETSLSNWPEIKANDFGFFQKGGCHELPDGPCGDDAWKRSAAQPVFPSTLKLFNVAKQNNVAVFFISGRNKSLSKPTVKNLLNAGYKGWDGLMLKDKGDKSSVQEFKTTQRRTIQEEKHYTIIANVGDQHSDLNGPYAERKFKVPNPFYFIP